MRASIIRHSGGGRRETLVLVDRGVDRGATRYQWQTLEGSSVEVSGPTADAAVASLRAAYADASWGLVVLGADR